MTFVANQGMVDKMMNRWIDQGYEGLIYRNLNAPHKEGRPNKGVWQLGRMKPWDTAEMLVEELIEGEHNTNPQKINSLGKAERSSSKAGKVPNGMIGSIKRPLLADLVHPYTKKLLLPKGHRVTVSRGEMSATQAALWFHNPGQIVGHIATFQYMPHGMVNELRMATFKSKRLPQDMS
jgi:DNA ligase-1